MNPEIKALIEKAKRSRKAAANLFKDGDVDFAASRAFTRCSTRPLLCCFHADCHFQAIRE